MTGVNLPRRCRQCTQLVGGWRKCDILGSAGGSKVGREKVGFHGYVSTKRADIAFCRHIFDALWSSAERFELS